MIHYDIIQGTEEWHQIRYGKIGGTRCKGLFTPTDTLLIELIGEAVEEYQSDEDAYVSDDMLRGWELEPEARAQLEQYTGIEFKTAGWIQHDEIPILGISPDGISNTEREACEIKCPSIKAHVEHCLGNEIPLKHIHQCLHYFTVNPNLEKVFFCSFRPEFKIRPLFVKELRRDSLVNLGTKARPVVKSVSEWVEIAEISALDITKQRDEAMQVLSF